MTAKHLQIRAQCIAGPAVRVDHIKSAMARGLPLFTEHKTVRPEPIAIVGSGPSVRTQVDALKEFKGPIMAIKGAHDFLIEHDIKPTWAVLIDPQTHIKKYFRHLRDDVVYLIASQVHPEIFDHFKGRNVVLCHMADSATREATPQGTQMIPGGSTSGLRGLTMSYLLGYRDMHLFGLDSCLDSDRLSRKVHGKDLIEPLKEGKDRIDVVVNGRTFWSDKAMAAQAFEIQQMLPGLGDARFTPYGDGLIQEILRCRKRLGNPDCGGELYGEPICGVSFMTDGSVETVDSQSPMEVAA